MKKSVSFSGILTAPCGIHCRVRYAFLREKNRCPGCRINSETKPAYCKRCIIAHCDLLKKTSSGFCYECGKFSCRRLKQLDKRYSTRYDTSLIRNLIFIKEKGLKEFLMTEKQMRTCNICGSIISIHRKGCSFCN